MLPPTTPHTSSFSFTQKQTHTEMPECRKVGNAGRWGMPPSSKKRKSDLRLLDHVYHLNPVAQRKMMGNNREKGPLLQYRYARNPVLARARNQAHNRGIFEALTDPIQILQYQIKNK